MTEQIYLGIDLGAESGRVMAGAWDGRAMRLEELHRFPNGGVWIGDSLRWDVVGLWREIQAGLAVAGKRYGGRVCSVGVDTWGVDYVLLSRTRELLGLPYHYRDSRTRGVMDTTLQSISRAEIFAATGLQFMEINTLFQLVSLRDQHPEVLAAADRFLMMPDFFNWCLSGEESAEFTNATTTQFYDPGSRSWSTALLGRLGIPISMLPRVAQPGERLGTLRPGVASRSGLGSVSVVAPATHDTGSAVAATPAEGKGRPDWAYISSGTWSLMGVEVSRAILTPRAMELNMTNEGGVEGTYRLLKNIMGLWLVQQCRGSFERQGRRIGYEELTSLAAAAAPLRSIVNPDHPSFLSPPDMPEAIRSECRRTGQPVPSTEGELIRCALESLALRYAITLEALEELTGQRVERIHIVGGGSRNDLLNQFAANACRRPVLAGPVEATALGNLLMQARASGEIGSLVEMRAAVHSSTDVRTFEPRDAAAWSDALGRFRQTLAAT